MLDWCDGKASAVAVRGHMQNALRDGFQHPMIARLANMGGTGEIVTSQHCHEGMVKLLDQCGVTALITPLPPPSGVTHVVLPSTYIRLLYTHYRPMFKRRFGAIDHQIRLFWEQFISRPHNREWASTHPYLKDKSASDLARTIPCTIHEDAGPVSKTLSADCLSFASLLGDGDEKVTKFLCASWVKSHECNTSSVWEAVLGDFHSLASGIVGGSAVAAPEDGSEPWTFVLILAKGDEDCHCNEWGLPHFSGADEVCSECLANRSNRPFTDLRACAEWRPTELMPAPHYLARVRHPLHPLLASAFFTRWCCFPDLMHMMDCKGVAALVLGGIIHYLLVDARLGANRELRLARINTEMAEWYNAHPGHHRMPRILLTNCVGSDGWANLGGPAIKAANTRAAAQPFQAIWHRYAVAGHAEDAAITKVIDNLADFYSILYGAPMFMPDDTIERVRRTCIDFGEAYMECREIARVQGALVWPVRTKTHKMQHVPLLCCVINPAHVQCYSEESLIGTTAKVWQCSIRGRHYRVNQRNVLLKRLTALLLRFEPYAA